MRKRGMAVLMLACMSLIAGCSAGTDEIYDESVYDTETELAAEMVRMGTEDIAAASETDETSISGRLIYAGAAYTWEEITVTIPKEWEDKFVVKEDGNGFSIYQIASNEVDVALGLLCGVYRSDQYSNSGMGETLVAYTDEGLLYYMVQPTDVNCYTEDEAVAEEYMDMMSCVEWIAGSIRIAGEHVHYDAVQYEIPVSSVMLLEEQHVANLTNNELWIARNEIYARHGKIFQNEYLNAYFNSCSWYEAKDGKNEISERELNEVEIANLKMIVAAEEAYAKEHPYPKQYMAGEEIEIALSDTEKAQRVYYEVTVGEDWENTCVLTIDETAYNLADFITLFTPVEDVFYVTDISQYDGYLEIAILDNGPSDDPVTHFFQYHGELQYIGEVQGFPFEDYGNNGLDGFTGQNAVMGTGRTDLIETAYVEAYYWYNSQEQAIEPMNLVSYGYKWFDAHELYVDIPVYYCKDENAPALTLQAQEEVFFIATDCKEWILVRGKDGVQGYIYVKDGQILNIGRPAEEVFSELYFFG